MRFKLRCFSPVSLKKKECYGVEIPELLVPCGKCPACLSKRSRDWQVRLRNEFEHCTAAHFLTLTYDPKFLTTKPCCDEDGTYIGDLGVVYKKDLQDFFKRLRFSIRPFKIRYYAVSEYGPSGTRRPHYHIILFNYPFNDVDTRISECWQKGFVTVSPLTKGRISYATKYCFKVGTDAPAHFSYPNFMLSSRKPGLGYRLYDKYLQQLETKSPSDIHFMQDGYKVGVPRYISDKYKRTIPESEKLDSLMSYVSAQFDESDYESRECLKRAEHCARTGEWYELEIEQHRRRFVERYERMYGKNRKI